MTAAGAKLPLASKDIIWEDTNISKVIMEEFSKYPIEYPTREKALEMSDKLIESSPNWIRYNHDDMRKDIFRLFYLKSERSAALERK